VNVQYLPSRLPAPRRLRASGAALAGLLAALVPAAPALAGGAPTVRLTSTPVRSSTSPAPAFSWRTSGTVLSTTCTLDGVTRICSSPARYAGLTTGDHAFAVVVANRSGSAKASYAWHLTAPAPAPSTPSAPTVTITQAPPATTTSTSASVAFAATTGAETTCALDGAAALGCTSPVAYTGLAVGGHAVVVTATTAGGRATATAAFAVVGPSAPDALYVAPGGDDAAAGTAGAPWRTLQHAAAVAAPGTTVLVRAGTYAAFAVTRSGQPDAPITFAAYPGERPVVQGDAGHADVIRLSGVHDVRITGLTVQGAPAQWGAGVDVASGSTRIVVRGCILAGNHSFGALIADSTAVTIADSLISGNDTGIQVSRAGAGVVLSGNRIVDNASMVVNDATPGNDRGANAIVLYLTTGHVDVADNEIHGNRAPSHDYVYDGGAFEIFGASDVAIHDNVVWDNENVMETGTDGSHPCDRIVFTRNVAYGAATVAGRALGLILRCASNSTFAFNTLAGLDHFVFDVAASGQAFGGSIDGLRIHDNVVTSADHALSIDSALPASVAIDHDLVWDTTGGSIAYVSGHGNTPSLAVLQGWTGLETNGIQAAPAFVDAAGHDYRLVAGSPGSAAGIGRYEPGAGAPGPVARNAPLGARASRAASPAPRVLRARIAGRGRRATLTIRARGPRRVTLVQVATNRRKLTRFTRLRPLRNVPKRGPLWVRVADTARYVSAWYRVR
jgi:nitrous oxidase accessory protein NosD